MSPPSQRDAAPVAPGPGELGGWRGGGGGDGDGPGEWRYLAGRGGAPGARGCPRRRRRRGTPSAASPTWAPVAFLAPKEEILLEEPARVLSEAPRAVSAQVCSGEAPSLGLSR